MEGHGQHHAEHHDNMDHDNMSSMDHDDHNGHTASAHILLGIGVALGVFLSFLALYGLRRKNSRAVSSPIVREILTVQSGLDLVLAVLSLGAVCLMSAGSTSADHIGSPLFHVVLFFTFVAMACSILATFLPVTLSWVRKRLIVDEKSPSLSSVRRFIAALTVLALLGASTIYISLANGNLNKVSHGIAYSDHTLAEQIVLIGSIAAVDVFIVLFMIYASVLMMRQVSSVQKAFEDGAVQDRLARKRRREASKLKHQLTIILMFHVLSTLVPLVMVGVGAATGSFSHGKTVHLLLSAAITWSIGHPIILMWQIPVLRCDIMNRFTSLSTETKTRGTTTFREEDQV